MELTIIYTKEIIHSSLYLLSPVLEAVLRKQRTFLAIQSSTWKFPLLYDWRGERRNLLLSNCMLGNCNTLSDWEKKNISGICFPTSYWKKKGIRTWWHRKDVWDVWVNAASWTMTISGFKIPHKGLNVLIHHGRFPLEFLVKNPAQWRRGEIIL